MTEANQRAFLDRRTDDQIKAELATPVLFWYDNPRPGTKMSKTRGYNASRNGRVRTNALAITMDGKLIVSNVTCYVDDRFVKSIGRMKAEQQLLGRARTCAVMDISQATDYAEEAASVYKEVFEDDETGHRRAFNAGKIFAAYRAEMARLANEAMNES